MSARAARTTFAEAAQRATRDVRLRQVVLKATSGKDAGRRQAFDAAFGERFDAVRDRAGAIRQHTLDHLDWYLGRFIERATGAGATVHAARDAAEANAIAVGIAQRRGARLCVKAKSMVTEETGLLHALQAAGVETLETDLGEFILQLDHDRPSHIVTPMIHKDRAAVGRAFERELGVEYTEDPRQLTMIAREHLRAKYRAADLGVTGANFLVAETGSVVLCTNEGNGRFCAAAPPVHVVVAGIEKVIPAPEHLGLLLKLLARSSTGQPLTCYTQVITGPRRPGETDGPEELHVILLDNGRTRLLNAEDREVLRCIRCGACLNACPVYRTIGGHAYGGVYSGPIGALVTPLLNGLERHPDLPKASSLCGACFDACPVRIDIPGHLVRLRGRLNRRRLTKRSERLAMRSAALVMRSPFLLRVALRALRAGAGRSSGPAGERWLKRLPGPLAGWTAVRDLPVASETFRQWWRRREPRR